MKSPKQGYESRCPTVPCFFSPALQAALGRDSFVAEFKASAAQIEERNEITILRRSPPPPDDASSNIVPIIHTKTLLAISGAISRIEEFARPKAVFRAWNECHKKEPGRIEIVERLIANPFDE